MTKHQDAMRRAIKVLEVAAGWCGGAAKEDCHSAIAALSAAVEEGEGGPVAWFDPAHIRADGKVHGLVMLSEEQVPGTVALYAAPQKGSA